MARKPPPPKKHYPAPFSVRLNKQEREELIKLADGQPLGQFIKDAILRNGARPPSSRKPRIQDQKLLAKLLGALGKSRIANNINQLAKAANSGSLPVNEEVLQSLNDAVAAIRWMRNALITGMGLKPQGEDPPEATSERSDDP